ncbi:YbaB/EbfC family nucleoid-associated protein [Actinocrispum wychmicini]|uniref:YbaB/EbfC DNA-binding family protein n=1 Tax=Actinocrispum wychmicini TaxID=1213861 RepID=A0A4R2K963_9PSEU|nr:YbaB/EbfC family nucleoid-associated protein [Actinocrispum wychmicini]TCO62935.1 YbaB/EbfC DNA-binding family protein [Actinocrispum wychmicini]
MSADVERLAAEFAKFQSKIQDAELRFSGVGEMQDQVARLEVVATSSDRTVRVVAGAGGAVTDIQLTPDAVRQPAPALAATIMATLREAVAEAVRRQADIVDEAVGAGFGLNTADQVRQAQVEALGTAVDELPSHSKPDRSARSDDDDFSQDTIYRHPWR